MSPSLSKKSARRRPTQTQAGQLYMQMHLEEEDFARGFPDPGFEDGQDLQLRSCLTFLLLDPVP